MKPGDVLLHFDDLTSLVLRQDRLEPESCGTVQIIKISHKHGAGKPDTEQVLAEVYDGGGYLVVQDERL